MRSILLVALAACGSSSSEAVDAAGPPVDAAIDAPECAATPMRLPDLQRKAWALAIAADGTTYVASNDNGHRVDRWRPGQSGFDTGWAVLPVASMLWSLAIDTSGRTLYVANDDGLWRVDTNAPQQPTRLAPSQTRAVTIGPGDEPYYTSTANGERVFRWTPSGAVQVSTTGFGEGSDLLFDTDGTLLASGLLSGLHRLTLDAGHVETGDAVLVPFAQGRVSAVGRDDAGDYYVGFELQGGLQRYDPAFAGHASIIEDGSIRDVVFARGYLGCRRLYVTTDDRLFELAVDRGGIP